MSSTLKSPVETAPSPADEDWDFLARLAEARENLDRVARRSAPRPEDAEAAEAAEGSPVLLEDSPSIADGGDGAADSHEPTPAAGELDTPVTAAHEDHAAEQPVLAIDAEAEHDPAAPTDADEDAAPDEDERLAASDEAHRVAVDAGVDAEIAPAEPAAEPPLETLAIHDTSLAPTQPDALADDAPLAIGDAPIADGDVPAWLKRADVVEPGPQTSSDRIYAGRSALADPLTDEAQRRAREASLDELFSISQQIRDDLIEIDKAAAALRRAPTYLEAGPVVVSEVVSVRAAPAPRSWVPLAALWGVGIAVAVLGTLSIVALTQ